MKISSTETKTSCMFQDVDESQDYDSENNSDPNLAGKTYNTTTPEQDDNEEIKNQLSKMQTKNVGRLRWSVIVILIAVSTAVSFVAYFITQKSEQNQFESQFEGAATKLIVSFETIIDRIGSVNALGIAATIQGMKYDNNTASWPYITMPAFQQRAVAARILASNLFATTIPLVQDSQRDAWERYTVVVGRQWIQDALDYQEGLGLNQYEYNPPSLNDVLMINYTKMPIFRYDWNHTVIVDEGPGPYLPRWQCSSLVKKKIVNQDLLKHLRAAEFAKSCIETHEAVFSKPEYGPAGDYTSSNDTTSLISSLSSIAARNYTPYNGSPYARLFIPMFDSFDTITRGVVGTLMSIIYWNTYWEGILPDNVHGIDAVLNYSCGMQYTYRIDGHVSKAIDFGDHHDPTYDRYERTGTLENTIVPDFTEHGIRLDTRDCVYTVLVYPSQDFADEYFTLTPALITFSVAFVFALTIATFMLYNHLVEKRQANILNKAIHSTTIVSSLFPKQVRNRLLESDEAAIGHNSGSKVRSLINGENIAPTNGSSVIADLFPNCTVMFADISGFTAWSSTRGPEHVFTLLQAVYQAFDELAHRRRVYKVETIGDCYLAVTGLPDPQSNHSVIIARFAWECKHRFEEITSNLEITLGPDCSDLKMRFGLHSGPVTAGVLKGDRARFQLFGDTVNTASRMESTGIRDRIHVSQATADLIAAKGKPHWITPREDQVEAKGKGRMQTYWLNPGRTLPGHGSATSDAASSSNDMDRDEVVTDPLCDVRRDRAVDWMVELLLYHLRQMKQMRDVPTRPSQDILVYTPNISQPTCPLDEVRDVISMRRIETSDGKEWNSETSIDAPLIEVSNECISDLRDYVKMIACLYNDNPFHNFDHACHVTMSVDKLLKRIMSLDRKKNLAIQEEPSDWLHYSSYGLNDDPLLHFAIVFSALIHDVDHRGCSNVQLMKEQLALGIKYRNKSVAEQNSLDIAWDLLMSDRFTFLRKEIFYSQEELIRFRQVIVNLVLATDIFDQEINDRRKARWQTAFYEMEEVQGEIATDRKATIVIEHIIQASDVAHTMQHWCIYLKWNQMLFNEMYLGFRSGRTIFDPSTFWYKGELNFFDNYVIPLSMKLKECQVFGDSSDEYFNYAVSNRAEWETRGEALVEQYVQDLNIVVDDIHDE